MEEKDFYTQVKPILNKLAKHNLFQNLYAIRYYMRKSFISISSDKDASYSIERPNECKIPPYLADFLIINSIKYSQTSSKLSLWSYKERYKVLSLLDLISNKVSDIPNRKDVFSWLKSFIFNQEKMQLGEDIRAIIYRYYYLYRECRLIQNNGY